MGHFTRGGGMGVSVTPGFARLATVILTVLLLLLALVNAGSIIQTAVDGASVSTYIYNITLTALIIICILLGLYGAITLHRMSLFVYTIFCCIFVVLFAIQAIISISHENVYGSVAASLLCLFAIITAWFAWVLWRSS